MASDDPLYEIERLLSNPTAVSTTRRKKKQADLGPSLPPLTPAEQESITTQLGTGVLSGIGYVGGFLDKVLGARAIRGLLGGKPEELLSILPGSDTFGLTDRTNIVTGKDLLKWEDPNSWLDDIAGIGLEVGLDPSTYLTFGAGALTKAGQLAGKAGIASKAAGVASKAAGRAVGPTEARLASTLEDVLRGRLGKPGRKAAADLIKNTPADELAKRSGEKLGGLVGIGLPFQKPLAVSNLGLSDAAARRVARGLDTAGSVIKRSAPVRHAAALFDARTKGATSELGQQFGKAATEAERAATSEARMTVANLVEPFHRSGDFDMGTTAGRQNMRDVRTALEGIGAMPLGKGSLGPLPAHLAGYAPQLQEIRTKLTDILSREQAAGLPTKDLDELYAEYFPRGKVQFAIPQGRGAKAAGRAFETTHPHQLMREEQLRNIPGGTETLNQLSLDPKFSGIAHQTGKLSKSQLDFLESELLQSYPHLNTLDEGQGRSLVRWLAGLDPQHVKENVPAFGRSIFDDLGQRLEYGERAINSARAAQDLLAEAAMHADDLPVDVKGVKLADVLKEMALTDTAMSRITGELAKKGIDTSDLNRLVVSPDVAADATRFIKSFTAPDEVKPVIEAMDKFLNLFKTSVTSMWPAFHVRNLFSGQFNNYVIGAYDPFASASQRYMQPLLDAHSLMQDGTIKGASRVPGLTKLSDRAATRKLAQEAYAQGLYGVHQGLATDTVSKIQSPLAMEIPGLVPQTPKNAGKVLLDPKPGNWNPLRVRGVGATENVFPPAKAGEVIGHYVEGLNRLAPFIALRKQGYSAAEAAQKVFGAQVDYGGLSRFESKVMKRLLPFYSYSRGIAPWVVNELMERPGGRLGASIRATNRARQTDQPLPEHISQTAAIPLGGAPEGFQRFITGLGLGHEDTLGMLRPGATAFHTLKGTGQELLGRLNPLVKAPLEFASGVQFFSGREMEDLDPTGARLIANLTGMEERPNSSIIAEQAISNSPLARLLTTARQLSDPRKELGTKAINALTGVRISDVDEEKAASVALRERLEQLLRGRAGVQRFESLYTPDPSKLTAQDALYMSLYRQQQLDKQAAKREKPKKKRRRDATVEDVLGDVL